MDKSTLLNKIKESSFDGEFFSLVLGIGKNYDNEAIRETANYLQNEMVIRLKQNQIQMVGKREGVLLIGKIL